MLILCVWIEYKVLSLMQETIKNSNGNFLRTKREIKRWKNKTSGSSELNKEQEVAIFKCIYLTERWYNRMNKTMEKKAKKNVSDAMTWDAMHPKKVWLKRKRCHKGKQKCHFIFFVVRHLKLKKKSNARRMRRRKNSNDKKGPRNWTHKKNWNKQTKMTKDECIKVYNKCNQHSFIIRNVKYVFIKRITFSHFVIFDDFSSQNLMKKITEQNFVEPMHILSIKLVELHILTIFMGKWIYKRKRKSFRKPQFIDALTQEYLCGENWTF